EHVVVWASKDQDGDGWGVYAQRYDAAGVAQGTEFRVNKATGFDQTTPSVAMDGSGNFVVTWTSKQNGVDKDVYARRFDATGKALTNEFRVNTFTTSDQQDSSIAMDAAGDFVITWSSNGQTNNWGIYAQRYDATGAAQGSEFQVNASDNS